MPLRSYNLVALLGAISARQPSYSSKGVLELAVSIYERPREFLASLTQEEKQYYTEILLQLEKFDQLGLF